MRWLLNPLAGVLIRRGRFGDGGSHGGGCGGRPCDAEGRGWSDVGQRLPGPCKAVAEKGRALEPPESVVLLTSRLKTSGLINCEGVNFCCFQRCMPKYYSSAGKQDLEQIGSLF